MKRLLIGLLLFGLLFYVEGRDVSADQPIKIPAEQPHEGIEQQPELDSVDRSAPSQTFTVLRTANIQDGNIGDGVCATGPTNSGSCTLFAAIQEANHTSAHDTINFNIPGAGPHTFVTQGSGGAGLPIITRPITIDGTSQPGANCPNVTSTADIRIQLEAGTNIEYGLRLGESADGSLIKGLSIGGYSIAGIHLNGADSVEIECNHIGVAPNGTTATPNNRGIELRNGSNNVVIGGTSSNTRAERNVISGNSGIGLFINNFDNDTLVTGNYIGTTALGTAALPNGTGIQSRGIDTDIGGSDAWERNTISGNNGNGLLLLGNANGHTIINNIFGRDLFGISAIPNSNGIAIQAETDIAPTDNIIGIFDPNIIANNTENGIVIFEAAADPQPVNNIIRANSIHSNGQIGIDLGNDGVDDNDVFDSDEGPNGYQNWPVLISAENSGRITGALPTQQSASSRTYVIDVYENSACDPSDNGEGQTYLDTFFMSGDGDIEPFTEIISPLPSTGKFLSLIATDSDGNSSEFGNCIEVDTATFVVDEANGGVNSDDINPGDGRCETNNNDCTLRAAIMEVNALGGDEPYNIYFDLGLTGLISLGSSSAIPAITVPVNMDGIADNPDTRCPESADDFATLRVTIRGTNLPASSDSIVLGAGSDGSTIHGIAFTDSQDSALHIVSDDNVVTCSWFGYGSNSAWSAGNSRAIDIVGNDNTIGGDAHADRNVIADSTNEGVRLRAGVGGNVISGNYIGTNQVGTSANANGTGINIADNATGNTIGGKLPNVISGNTTDGILINGNAHSNTIAGNIIGLDRTGSVDGGNGSSGIRLDGVIATTIGGKTADERNVISGNNQHGIYLTDTEDTTITNNYIGTNRDGSSAIGNLLSGIRDDRGEDNLIGGGSASDGNIIGGNGRNGIYLLGNTLFPIIQNNLIGLTAGSRATIGNSFYGIHIDASSGFATTQATIANNDIAFNMRDGVRVDSVAVFTHLSANNIFENGWLGIDLDEDGENSPVVGATITTASADDDKIIGEVSGISNNDYRVDIFASSSCDSSGYGEGERYLGSDTITLNGSGNGDFGLVSTLFDGGEAVTVTLTRLSPAPDTSEFSQCFTATGATPTAVRISEQAANADAVNRWLTPIQGTVIVFVVLMVGSVVVLMRRFEA